MRRRRRKLLRCSSVLDGDGSDPLNKQASKQATINGKDGSFLWYINTPSTQAILKQAREREREMLERERQNDAGASVCLSGCSLQRWIDGCIDRCLANSLLLVVEREGERGFLVVNY
jgi:hypothetical protein